MAWWQVRGCAGGALEKRDAVRLEAYALSLAAVAGDPSKVVRRAAARVLQKLQEIEHKFELLVNLSRALAKTDLRPALKDKSDDAWQETEAMLRHLRAAGVVCPNDIVFEPNEDVLSGDGPELLGEVAEQLKWHTGVRILLDGHSHVPDSPRSQLMELAEGRAKTVLAALKMLGIDESRMATCGSGNTGRGMKVYITIRSIDKLRPKDEPEFRVRYVDQVHRCEGDQNREACAIAKSCGFGTTADSVGNLERA